MTEPETEINRLLGLGYAREDIQILPDGQVIMVPHDEYKSTADTIARATAPERLKKMLARKSEIQSLVAKLTMEGQALPLDLEEEYRSLIARIESTQALIDT